MDYGTFLSRKFDFDKTCGFDVSPEDINPLLIRHQPLAVQWALKKGRAALFEAFGLGKTFQQLEIARLVQLHAGGRFMICAPLGVRGEFMHDVQLLTTGDSPRITDDQRRELREWQEQAPGRIPTLRFVRTIEECDATGIYITNYETVRDGKLDPKHFNGSSLDEADCLRGFGGTKTFREFMKLFAGDDRSGTLSREVPYRFVATATPSPNEYIELLAYASYLGIMQVGEAKTRFFKRDATKADELTIHPHKEREFWLWVSGWALFIQKPSDLGFSDEGYDLPEMEIHWHEVSTDHGKAGTNKHGQGLLLKNVALGVTQASAEKRESLPTRIEKMMELRDLFPAEHCVIWHDLERERLAIEKAIPGIRTVYGAQALEPREQIIADFSAGKVKELATKPILCGSGCNFQRYCAWEIFLGIGFKFKDFIQAIHRVQRFLQKRRVRIDIIYSEAEREVRRVLEGKWAQHKILVENMSKIIKEFGLSQEAMQESLRRSIGVERIEVEGKGWRAVNTDSVEECAKLADNSVHLVLTSIPFSMQYEYTPSYNDFGHNASNEEFWKQMDYLTPNLLRALRPGRICCIHVKDRIIPGGLNGMGFQTVYPLHVDAIQHYVRHGFAYMGMKSIITDVVRENNQTYRLGWTEQCKDGTKMGVGMPEYLLIFRKPPSSNEKSYADNPVIKNKGKYSRSRWQIDAHAFAKSSGNRLINPAELETLPHDTIFQLFKGYSQHQVYDYEQHVHIGEHLEGAMRLPVTFMLLQPQSWSDEVWSDVTRMLSLNSAQSAAGRETHLCPMQFDIADRAITQYTMEGETVLDPFGGLMSVGYRALPLRRKFVGMELNSRYFFDGVQYLQSAEREISMPGLFDLVEMEKTA